MNHCIDCRHFVDHEIMGQCRAHPQFFNKHRNDWCGELSPKALQNTTVTVSAGSAVVLPVVDAMTDRMPSVEALEKAFDEAYADHKKEQKPKRKYTRRGDAKTSA